MEVTCNVTDFPLKCRRCEINSILNFDIYVTAAGLRASNSRNTSVWPEWIRLGTRRIVTATRSVTVMEYYYLFVGGLTH